MKNSDRIYVGVLLSIVVLLILTACATNSTTTSETEPSPIGNTYWELESYALSETGELEIIPDSMVVIYYGDNDSLFGFGGCNFMRGSYLTDGDAISVNSEFTTAFECPQDLAAQEQAIATALTLMGTFQEDGEQMKLSNPNGTEFINMSAITPPPTLAGTEWKLQSFNDGQGAVVQVLDGSEITAIFGTDGTLSGSAGCNNYSTTYEVSGDNLIIGETISTEKACLEPEGVMEQETQYLAALRQSTIARNLMAGLILLDAEAKPTTIYLANK